jgi:PleD family two-component response regulator
MSRDDTDNDNASRDDAPAGGERRHDLVLLVDDDPVARLLTASALAERHWRVIEADGGAHALELFAENQPRSTASSPASGCADWPAASTCRC